MKKLSTGIKGLDMLLLGGLQVDRRTFDCDHDYVEKGLTIVLKGACRTDATFLAMLLMHGLTKSIYAQYSHPKEPPATLFYSINKNSIDLEDQYMDMIISRQIQRMIRNYRIAKFRGEEDPVVAQEQHISQQAIFDFLFEMKDQKVDRRFRAEIAHTLAKIGPELPHLICENIVYYNIRTNALHLRRLRSGDDFSNMLALRRHNRLNEYLEDLNLPKFSEFKDRIGDIGEFYRDLVPSNFVGFDILSGSKTNMEFYAKTPMSICRGIIEKIEDECEKIRAESEESKQQSGKTAENKKEADDKHVPKYEVVVIDGFSQLTKPELEELPYTHIRNVLNRIAKVAILVLDERADERYDGDIVIEMCKNYAEREEYEYTEMQIVKSAFQETALGWHRYKRRDSTLEVFPSLHNLLSKRFYMLLKSRHIGQGIFENNFEQYLSIAEHQEIVMKDGKKLSTDFFVNYENYLEKCKNEPPLWKHLFEKNADAKKDGSDLRDILETLLLRPTGLEVTKHFGWEDHFAVTGIIGNPNSFKRYLAMAAAYSYAKRGIHTLFMLFDKNELDMRRRMVCPAFHGCDGSDCSRCVSRIHMFDFRMGCISAEEFLATLLDQIAFYCEADANTEKERSWLHIVIDDLQKIDYSFPFLSSNPLFLSALISLCHHHKVKLTILCDKKAFLTQELCSLADNLICIKRESELSDNKINALKLYVERNVNMQDSSRIIRYEIEDVQSLFSCEQEGISFNKDLVIKADAIGSMKEYWRQTMNVVSKK